MQFKQEDQRSYLARPRSVLLIDDDLVLPELLRPVVLASGYVLSSVRDASGIESINLTEFDVIILDLMMPDTDGVDTIPRLARADFMGGLILLSGLTEDCLQSASAAAEAFNLDVLASLRKPVSSRALQSLLSAYNYKMLRRTIPQ